MTHVENEAGITLVEIALSLAILGLVLTTFFTVITGGLQSLSNSRARQTSSQVATEIIEDLRAMAPSEIAMYVDPAVSEPDEFDATSVSCGGVPGQFDPDGSGPIGCEVVKTNPQGAITGAEPYQDSVEILTVTTVATEATGTGMPAGTVRVTIVLDYTLPDGAEQIRRSALFSEVNRGG